MGTFELKGIGLPVGDQEIDTLELFDSNEGTGIRGLLRKAGAVSADWNLATGPLTYHPDDLDEYHRSQIDQYRHKSGRQHPQLYRIRILVEAEPLSDAENEAAWNDRRNKRPLGLNEEREKMLPHG